MSCSTLALSLLARFSPSTLNATEGLSELRVENSGGRGRFLCAPMIRGLQTPHHAASVVSMEVPSDIYAGETCSRWFTGRFDFTDMARSSLAIIGAGLCWRCLFRCYGIHDSLTRLRTTTIGSASEDQVSPAEQNSLFRSTNGSGRKAATGRYIGRHRGHISITTNYRDQFNLVINNQGLEALMNECGASNRSCSPSLRT